MRGSEKLREGSEEGVMKNGGCEGVRDKEGPSGGGGEEKVGKKG